MDLGHILAEGLIAEYGKPERVITTVISRLFVYKDKVVKLYNREPYFFADLKDLVKRKAFIAEDFFWNNSAAPEIYTHLWGVALEGDTPKLVPPSLGEDHIVEMGRIDDSQTLTKLLLAGSLTAYDIALFMDALVDTLATLTRERHEHLLPLYSKGLIAIMHEDIESLYSWMAGVPEISTDDASAIKTVLITAVASDAYFKNAALSAAIDNNSDNLLLLDGHPSFIDIMPPAYIWRLVDEYATISRTVVDIEALGTPELAATARRAYAKYGRVISPIAALVHEIRAACIQWSYRCSLSQPAIAAKFGALAKTKAAELRQLLG